ncbi:MAG: methylenetetrahydrofolate reductase [Apilactobacillus sp.]|uniref:methylenetetrahydrofolate reductase n=1 Tax=Apilactobacillus TaxID=2767877 RepID=UPI0025E72199|nr:methylenetetrahydrofolate reductase [Apilactobacillus sp.]MCT6823220.1 methylenetetrahydrofolate reductase [Apilactobacillus sp.]MCT6858311.1 methylenetetrahydrofolate reductase [Apilactobacillus sp.]
MRDQTFSVEIEANSHDLIQMKHYINKWKPDFVSISNLSRYSYEEMLKCAKYIQRDLGVPVVLHLTGLSHTKEEIKKAYNELRELNIKNLLLVRGNLHHNMKVKDDFRFASDLIKYVKQLNEDGRTNIVAACYPDVHFFAESLKDDVFYLKQKVDTGVDSLISLMCFDNYKIYNFLREAHKNNIDIPIRIGIMPITDSFKKHYLLHNEIEAPAFLDKTEDMLTDGIEYAINQINDLYKNNVNGIHLYTQNDWEVSDRIYTEIKHNFE